MSKVIAIFCADLHLSHTPPVARSAEPDWYAAMARPLKELRELAERYGCPVICAGDVFDRWNSPPELINFAMGELPEMYAIPGQHDLPHHNYDDIKRSAYWTLVIAGVVKEIDPIFRTAIPGGAILYGFPWGKEVEGLDEQLLKECPIDVLRVAVIHAYCWLGKSGYPNSPKGSHLSRYGARLKGYDVAVFGDNHQGFVADYECMVFNCGCLIPRRQDEREYKPAVGLLLDDGSVQRHELDTSQDKWLDVEDDPVGTGSVEGLDEFLDTLNELDVHCLDFREAVVRYLDENKPGKGTEKVLLEAMEDDV